MSQVAVALHYYRYRLLHSFIYDMFYGYIMCVLLVSVNIAAHRRASIAGNDATV